MRANGHFGHRGYGIGSAKVGSIVVLLLMFYIGHVCDVTHIKFCLFTKFGILTVTNLVVDR